MILNVTYDSSVATAPSGFKAAVEYAVEFFESEFTNPITVNIAVGYGEIDGQPLGAGDLGESLTFLDQYSYSQVSGALRSAGDSLAQVPASNPTPNGSGNFWVATAEAKALGLSGPSSSIDGYVGFDSSTSFTFDPGNRAVPGKYDFIGDVEHEISEVLGRQLLVGQTFDGVRSSYEPLDLFHYSSAGVRDFSGRTTGYFSDNGGTTNLDNFNTDPGGDFGDWASTVGSDSFLAFSNSGVANPVTPNDMTLMNVLGYDLAGSATSGVTIGNTQVWNVSSGVVDIADSVFSGGTENVLSGGLANVTVVVSGGVQSLLGGTASGTFVDSSGTMAVFAGVAHGTIVVSGGNAFVESGASADASMIDGGIEAVESEGTATSVLVGSGYLVVGPGGSAFDTVVQLGADLIAGEGVDTTVGSGGLEVVEAGGIVFGTTVRHGTQVVFGVASGTTVSSNATEVVWGAGASSFDTVVESGGFEFVVTGGIGSDTTVEGSGTEFVVNGGTAEGTLVNAGGVLVVSSSLAVGTTLDGTEVVDGGGVASATSVTGGALFVETGGSAAGGFVTAGGAAYLYGGVASGLTIEANGAERVEAGGDALATTIDGGGLMEVASGGFAGTVTFASSEGTLQLDQSVGFGGLIAGFDSSPGNAADTNTLDLRDIAFGGATSVSFAEAGNNLSGTLTVTDGTHTAQLTLLGQYSTIDFKAASDSHGGTDITDPDASAAIPGGPLAAHVT